MPIHLFSTYAERLFDAISNVIPKNNKKAKIDVGSFIERYALDVLGSAGFGKGKTKKKSKMIL